MDRLTINKLEEAWSEKGALGLLRRGKFDKESCEGFLKFLDALEFEHSNCINRRTVALMWYIPTFLEWQKERVLKVSGLEIAQDYTRYANQMMAVLETKLGTP